MFKGFGVPDGVISEVLHYFVRRITPFLGYASHFQFPLLLTNFENARSSIIIILQREMRRVLVSAFVCSAATVAVLATAVEASPADDNVSRRDF